MSAEALIQSVEKLLTAERYFQPINPQFAAGILHSARMIAIELEAPLRELDADGSKIKRVRFNGTLETVLELGDDWKVPDSLKTKEVIAPKSEYKIIHVYCDYPESDPSSLERIRVAKKTWDLDWVDFPVGIAKLKRTAEDGASLYFIRDLLDAACEGRNDNDVVAYTNTDICLHSKLIQILRDKFKHTNACYSFRRDFYQDFSSPKPDDEITKGKWYIGADLFVFRVWWWRVYRRYFPDMILGREAWDAIFRTLIDMSNDRSVAAMDGLIYHRKHSSIWERRHNRYALPGQIHCIRLAYAWCKQNKINPSQFGLRPVKVVLWPHQGMGDHIICNGLYRTFAKHGPVEVLCLKRDAKNVRHMLADVSDLRVIEFKDEGAIGSYATATRADFRIGNHSSFGFDRFKFDQEFYRQAGIPFDYRWSRWEIPDIVQAPVPEGDFIFVHDKPEHPIPMNGANIVRPRDIYSIFSYRDTLLAARELHCNSSAFAAFADCLDLSGKRLVFYSHGREVPKHKNKWEYA